MYIVKAKESEDIQIHSMGKRFRIVAIASNDDAANKFCTNHSNCGVIACLGPLIFIAELNAANPPIKADEPSQTPPPDIQAMRATLEEIANDLVKLEVLTDGKTGDAITAILAKAIRHRDTPFKPLRQDLQRIANTANDATGED